MKDLKTIQTELAQSYGWELPMDVLNLIVDACEEAVVPKQILHADVGFPVVEANAHNRCRKEVLTAFKKFRGTNEEKV